MRALCTCTCTKVRAYTEREREKEHIEFRLPFRILLALSISLSLSFPSVRNDERASRESATGEFAMAHTRSRARTYTRANRRGTGWERRGGEGAGADGRRSAGVGRSRSESTCRRHRCRRRCFVRLVSHLEPRIFASSVSTRGRLAGGHQRGDHPRENVVTSAGSIHRCDLRCNTLHAAGNPE